jgi:GNAT superfamily N-acetyltransferase
MSYTVSQVATKKDLKEFIRFPLDLYRDMPLFVPHLLRKRKKFFSRSNPIFEFTDVAYFLARDGRWKTVGRVTAHINHRAAQAARTQNGCFGFFECTADIEAASVLMQAAENWLRSRGMATIQGPFNFSTNEECGFLARGFVPMTETEFDYAAHEFKPIIEPSLVLVAEKEGRMVGLSLSLPDYNVVLQKMRGRLFLFGFLHFLFGRHSIRYLRVILLGVLREYRRSGIDLLLIEKTFRNGLVKGYDSCDMSWILEDNQLMRRALERMGATVGKVHRVYEKKL